MCSQAEAANWWIATLTGCVVETSRTQSELQYLIMSVMCVGCISTVTQPSFFVWKIFIFHHDWMLVISHLLVSCEGVDHCDPVRTYGEITVPGCWGCRVVRFDGQTIWKILPVHRVKPCVFFVEQLDGVGTIFSLRMDFENWCPELSKGHLRCAFSNETRRFLNKNQVIP